MRALWTLALNNPLTAPPAFSGTRAYFPIEGDLLAAYDLALGRQLWVVSARIVWEPAVGDGLLFLVESDGLAALHEANGSLAWRLPFAEPLASPLVWDNGWLIAAGASGTILAFRALDGELIWRRDVGSPVHAPPALAADRVYVPAQDGRIVALRVDTGEPVWERRLGGAPNEVLALDDRLYVGSNDNFFYCVRTSDGEVDWRWRTGGDVIGMPVVDEHRVYFASLDNVLRGLDRKSGSQRWKRALPLRPSAGPLKAADMLIVGGVAPTLRAYLMKDGAQAGELPTGGEMACPPRLLDIPGLPTPTLVIVTRDIAKGATVTAMTRAIEPAIAPLAPLLNPIPVTPAAVPPTRP